MVSDFDVADDESTVAFTLFQYTGGRIIYNLDGAFKVNKVDIYDQTKTGILIRINGPSILTLYWTLISFSTTLKISSIDGTIETFSTSYYWDHVYMDITPDNSKFLVWTTKATVKIYDSATYALLHTHTPSVFP